MSKASVQISTNSSAFQREMKKAAQSMKELCSETSLATTQAKLFGSAQDVLKAKISGLQAQISQQTEIVKLNKDRQQELVQQLEKQQKAHADLQDKVQATKEAIKQSTAATGENSGETKALKDELTRLTKEEKEAAEQVGKTEANLSRQTTAANKSEQALAELQIELKETNEQLKNADWEDWCRGADAETAKAAQSMKELCSETSLATTQAKLFGTSQDVLEAKVSGLQKQIERQTSIVELNKKQQQELVQQLEKQQKTQEDLRAKVQATEDAIKQSTAATGENSDETKALKDELARLTKEEEDAVAQVEKIEDRMSRQTVAANESEEALAELQIELKKVNKELDNAAWDEWTKKADKVTGAMDNVGKKLTVVTGAVVGTGAAAIKMTADFDVGMSNVKAISGATGDDFDALREKALEMGSKTAFSASEAAAAMEYMAQAGWTTEDMLAGIEGVMNAAAASGEDLASTSNILTEGLNAFGMAAGESGRFADILVAAGNASSTSVADMGETFKQAGAICGTLGITVEDAAVATGLMANAGIRGSEAGTALRSGLANLVNPTKAMSDAMKKYGVSIQTTDDGSVDFMATMQNVRAALGGLDETTQAAALSTIFGKEAMTGWATVVNASEEDFQTLTDTISNCTGMAQEASEVRLDNLSGQITILKSTIEGIAIQIGDLLMPTIRNVVAKIQEWATAFAEADEDTKKTIVTIAGVVAAIGPLILGISGAIKTVKNVVGAFENMKTMLTALKVALGGPTLAVAGIVAAIAALVAAFMHLWNTNEGFRTAITTIWNEITGTVSGFIQGIQERLNGMGITFESVSAAISVIWNALCEFLAPVFEGAFQAVSDILTWATETLLGIWDFWAALFQGDWEGVWNAVQSLFGSAWQFIADIFQTILDTLKGAADVVLGWFGTDWNTAWSSICGFFTGLWDGAKTTVAGIWDGIKTAASDTWDGIKATATSTWEAIKAAIIDPITAAKEKVSEIIDNILGVFDFDWSLPKLKLPHLKITGEFSIAPPSVPKFSIDWYKTGAIMDGETIFGMNGNNFLGGGEAGQEAILPLEPFYARLGRLLDIKLTKLGEQTQEVVVYVTCLIDGEEIAARQITKVEKHLAGSSRAIRRATA